MADLEDHPSSQIRSSSTTPVDPPGPADHERCRTGTPTWIKRVSSSSIRRGLLFMLSTVRSKRAILLHASIVAMIYFHIAFSFFYIHRVLTPFPRDFDTTASVGIQLAAYPVTTCLFILAPSRPTEKIVSCALLGLLALIVVFVSIGSGALHIGIMFAANTLAISSYTVWKLYLAARPWLHRWWIRKISPIAEPWLQYLSALFAPAWQEEEEEETGIGTGLLLPQQQQQERRRRTTTTTTATFRIQADLPQEFSHGEVHAMTQGLRTMVGQGGFAQVFRGLLDDGSTAVAVKRIAAAASGGEDDDDDFLRDVSIVATVHHRSLVHLLGYCLPCGRPHRYLVYPFLENGSLDSWLFHGGEERRRRLPWPTRRTIAVDVAKALAYLHHECRQQILHLDIKPGNVLLDADLRAHVSDFGISMSVTRGLSTVDTRGRGTPGYMAPEMLVNAVSAKSDVFSYGMTLLELVGGRRNFDPTPSASSSATPDFARDFFPYIVREKMARGALMETVDAAMPLVDQEEVEAVMKVALCCIQGRWDMRPTMLTVVDMLEGRVAADLPPESRHLSSVNVSDDLLSSSLTSGR